MFSKVNLAATVLLVFVLFQSATAQSRKLTDDEMDRVTGGDASVELVNGLWKLTFDAAAAGAHVSGDGTVEVLTLPNGLSPRDLVVNDTNISLSGDAQQNLSSFVNITAANSIVNVLLNVNINMPGSVVGTVSQANQHP